MTSWWEADTKRFVLPSCGRFAWQARRIVVDTCRTPLRLLIIEPNLFRHFLTMTTYHLSSPDIHIEDSETFNPVDLPKVIITPSTPSFSPNPGKVDSTPSPRSRKPSLQRTLFEIVDPDPQHLSPSVPSQQSQLQLLQLQRAQRDRPRKHTTVSFVLLVCITLLISLTSMAVSSNDVMAQPSMERLSKLSQAMNVRLRLALDIRQHQSLSTTIQRLVKKNEDTQLRESLRSQVEESEERIEENENRSGYAMSSDGWRAYLRSRESVSGWAGPITTLDAWDFH